MSDILKNLKYLEGTSFCIVYMTVIDQITEKVKLAPVYGTAKVLSDRLMLREKDGKEHVVPTSALPSIMVSDGNDLLKDAANYVIVKIAQM